MDTKKHVELLTTQKSESVGSLIVAYASASKAASQLMNNALENNNILVVGREAAKIVEYSELIVELLKSK